MCVVWQPLRAPGMASEQGRDHGAVVHGKVELCRDKREIGESWNEHPSKNTPILWEEAQIPHSLVAPSRQLQAWKGSGRSQDELQSCRGCQGLAFPSFLLSGSWLWPGDCLAKRPGLADDPIISGISRAQSPAPTSPHNCFCSRPAGAEPGWCSGALFKDSA